MRVRWTPEKKVVALETLKVFFPSERKEALDELSRRFGLPPGTITAASLQSMFYNSDVKGTISHHMVGFGRVASVPEAVREPIPRPVLPLTPPADVPMTEAVRVKDETPDVTKILDESAVQRQVRRLRAEHAEMVDRLREANARSTFVESIAQPPPPPIVASESASGLREGTAVVLASDWHVEETVDPIQVTGRNEYNLAISARRSSKFFDGVRWLVNFNRGAFAIRSLILWIGGDIISGYIHPELAESNELSPVEAVLFAKGLISNGIAKLLTDPQLERLVVPCSFGNHGRTTEKRRIQTGAENSYEWLMYNVLRDEWAHEPRVEFVVDRSAHQYVNVYGDDLHFTHGDELKYGGGIGGLTIPLMKRVPAWDRVRRSTVHHLGHFHQYMPLRRAVVNGSLIGFNPFAMSIGAEPEPPQQAFYIYDSKRGKCMETPVWVDAE